MNSSPDQILESSSSEPDRALELARSFIAEGLGTARERSIVLRACSIASRVLGNLDDALESAVRARAAAIEAGDGELELMAVLEMAGPMAMNGRADGALELIETTASLASTPYLEARVSYQLGVIAMIRGEPVEAIHALESGLSSFRDSADETMTRSTLHLLGNLKITLGRLREAEVHLSEALEISLRREEWPYISGIKHNLGLLASYRGDIPEALALLTESDEIYMRFIGASAPQHATRCEVLLSVGLFKEALELAREVTEGHRISGDREHLPHALLVTARAALLAGQLDEALAAAEEAIDVLDSQGRSKRGIEVRRFVVEARHRREGASRELFREAAEVAAALESEELLVEAAQAHLQAGRIALDLGDAGAARAQLEPVTRIRAGPVELRIHARMAKALTKQIEGDRRGADAATRAGLQLLEDYQKVLGATDVRMGLERHGAELGALGLGLALESGRPRRILRWMERTRARALLNRPVTSDEDEEVREALARLRKVEAELGKTGDRHDAGLQRQRRHLQELIKSTDRRRRGGGSVSARLEVRTLLDGLGKRVLLEIAIHDGRLVGVLARNSRAHLIEMGDAAPVLNELGHVRFGMRRSARRGRPVDMESLRVLDNMILGALPASQEQLVLVPPPELMAVPWSSLPSLAGRPVTVSPSAQLWWRSARRPSTGTGVVVAGGPDLTVAGAEVAEIGGLYDDAEVLPPGSSVEDVRAAMEGATIAHIASHASFQVENPMFSALRLGDGDLNVYDIERLQAPPSLVILSACDSGYTESRSGEELAGITSALLSMGTRSVVASVGLVPDSSATSDLMVDFHRGLIDGLDPAVALSRAQQQMGDDPERFVAAASFICVGA
ncbi:MAG: CHAT domain-containing protein [Actinomycetota bacterium]